MSKKISLKKLVKIAEESKSVSPTARSTPTVKGLKIDKKNLRDEKPNITPTKKGKSVITLPKEIERKVT